ncbi:MAG: hypothetical protein EOO38_11050 [Cytophagaceae bacterium]|nr:MAG: hypothetical protein EOO38_11050 [Cytophagaceae bacterium]
MKSLYTHLEEKMDLVERRWKDENFCADVFPDIVWDATHDLDLSALGEVSNQIKLLELPGVRFQQQRSTFSDLYIQVYHNGRFMIEILNWWGGHVNVHDHDFSSVQFQLKGSALNASYKFDVHERAGALRFGDLKLSNADLWQEGSRSLVRPGPTETHGVFHLGEPTTSLLIRTTPTPRYGAQSNYFPSIAAHYYVANDIQRKKLTALGLLARKNELEFRANLAQLLKTQSVSENFFMLLKLGTMV